jgi:hypothetical protein
MATKKVVVKVKPRRRYDDGGKVVPQSFVETLKRATGFGKSSKEEPERTPTISGGMQDAMKRREERMDAVTKGKADPGQTPDEKKYARGGKVKRK